MKLSEKLALLAEWWGIPYNGSNTQEVDKLACTEAYLQMRTVFGDPTMHSNEAAMYLCLLEAEYQKDEEAVAAHNFDLDADMQ